LFLGHLGHGDQARNVESPASYLWSSISLIFGLDDGHCSGWNIGLASIRRGSRIGEVFKPNDEKLERPTKTPGEAWTHCRTCVRASRTSIEFCLQVQIRVESDLRPFVSNILQPKPNVDSLPPPSHKASCQRRAIRGGSYPCGLLGSRSARDVGGGAGTGGIGVGRYPCRCEERRNRRRRG